MIQRIMIIIRLQVDVGVSVGIDVDVDVIDFHWQIVCYHLFEFDILTFK